MHESWTDKQRYEQLFRDHYQPLCLFAYSYLKDMDAAKDVVQDFFFRCWGKRESLSTPDSFEKYAFRAIRNSVINYQQSIATRNRHNTQSAAPDIYDPQSEESVLQKEDQLKAALLLAIQGLPEQRRKIFLLSNGEGYKYSEIADQLNISINTVKTQLRKAYETLRQERERLEKLLISLVVFKIFYTSLFF
ncbi:RNA polymerase sigma-70 factor [Chitinophaga sp. CF418]|uniref:RNA polymerase sigma-70 factor n=1 Tax=Chitinophaga sp. CF418 TaxID=1855287 RepID=UPI00091E3584|nr:RNA polymerase sigma-70 factor [Chitinophaga sp. CF418]SHN36485.1 RNA polymerase sigma-70 factor, ECF subfamily [Chitinophaga sp. CF418]